MQPTILEPLSGSPPAEGVKLTSLVGLTTLQNLQDRFAALGRMTVCTCTVDGSPITRPTWGSRYSELLGTSRRGGEALANAIRACAGDPDGKRETRCLEGMMVYVTPITVGEDRLGNLAIGIRKHLPPREDVVRRVATSYAVDAEELLAAAARLNPWRGGTPDAIRRFADVLAHMIASLYGQAERIVRQLADLQTVHSLAELLSGTLDLQRLLDLTVRRVAEVMSVKACAIRLLNAETGELVIKAVHNLSQEYLRKGPVLLQNSDIDAIAFSGQTVYIEDAPTDKRLRYPEKARREGIVSGLCAPLTYRGQTVGVIRVYTDRRHVFSESEESLLRSIASQAAAAIIHTRLYEERAAAERVQRQLEAAAQIQRRMLPARPVARVGLEFGCVYDPSLQVGGDFYDFVELPGGGLGVCVSDVMGKGLPAALLMASIRTSLRAHAPQGDGIDVAGVVGGVNRQMHAETLVGEFATLVYGVFSPDGRSFTCCNAGHPPPLLLRDDQVTELSAGGLAIGINPDEPFEQEVVPVRSGDLLIIVTDGVTDAMDFEGRSYGHGRLLASIQRHRRLGATQLAQQLLWDVRRFVGLAEQSDDITIVAVRVN